MFGLVGAAKVKGIGNCVIRLHLHGMAWHEWLYPSVFVERVGVEKEMDREGNSSDRRDR